MAKKKTAGKPKSEPSSLTFEQAAQQLDKIVDQLEVGKLDLAESLKQYEAGVGLLKQCYQMLQTAEQKIELLTGIDSSGEVQVEPFDDSASEMDESGQTRSRKRSSQPTSPDESRLF